MNDIEKLFLSLLSEAVSGEIKTSQEVRTDADSEELYRLAEAHSLSGFLFPVLKIDHSLWKADSIFRKDLLGCVFLSVNRTDILKDIAREFEAEGIDFICMKGSVFRDCYPMPELRSMGDVDIVIHSKDRTAADRIMREKIGCEKFVDNHSVWTYFLGDFQFEVHDHMFYENLANKVDYKGYFDKAWDHCHNGPAFGVESSNLYVPDEDFHFLYLMAHTAKHVLNNGSGFRSYLDMVFMAKECGDRMDWKKVSGELEKLKLLTFTKTCFSCCERWFGVEMPMRLDALDEGLFTEITEKTFRDGVFGLENAENRPASAAKDIKRSDTTYFLGAVKRGFKRLFPPYRDLQLVPWYSWVDGKPWLLPAAWVYRWFYCATKKLKHSVKFLAEPFAKKEDVLERQKLMKDWGL